MRLRFLALALFPLQLSAQAVRDSIISVSASRVSRVAPDRASIYLIVEGTAETPADAITRVETKLKAVSDALRALGSRVTLDPPIAYGVGPTPAPNGYPGTASNTHLARSVIRAQITRPDQIANIVAAAIAAGAASSSSLTFESSAADSIRRARIDEVLHVARLDAEAIARSMGGHLGALVGVTSTGNAFGFQGPSMLTFDTRYNQQAPTPEISITTSVSVQYKVIR